MEARKQRFIPGNDRGDVGQLPCSGEDGLKLLLISDENDLGFTVREQIANLLDGLLLIDPEADQAGKLRRQVIQRPAQLRRAQDGDAIALDQRQLAQPSGDA